MMISFDDNSNKYKVGIYLACKLLNRITISFPRKLGGPFNLPWEDTPYAC